MMPRTILFKKRFAHLDRVRGLKIGASLPGWFRAIAGNGSMTWLERKKRQLQQEKIDLIEIADSADSPE